MLILSTVTVYHKDLTKRNGLYKSGTKEGLGMLRGLRSRLTPRQFVGPRISRLGPTWV